MANQERINHSRERITIPDRDLETIASHQREAIKENAERHEQGKQEKSEDIKKEALEKASSRHEKEHHSHERERLAEKSTVAKRSHGKISKKQKELAFKKTVATVQSELPPVSRTFSKFIHNKAVEKASDVVGGTIARPNAILSGSAFAFAFTLIIFLVARHYGYPLSGAETIAGFIVGWATGLLYDYLRLMISGRPS